VAQRGKSKKTKSPVDIEPPLEIQPHKEELLSILQALPPDGFERLCQRLLRVSGFSKVVVTGKSGDGGIDGEGILEINPLVSLKVIFQAKRYKGAVSASQIRDFRGAMQGRAEKGIFITTGRFTQEAKNEALREGAPPIELVDANKLTVLFEQRKLGLKSKIVYEIDDGFFEDYR
jgi:restriction system protein